MDREAIRQHLNAQRDWLERTVVAELRRILEDARNRFRREYPGLSAPKPPECRVKEIAKLLEKLEKRGSSWSHDKSFIVGNSAKVEVAVNDLVGGRLVCSTPKDVDAVVGILEGWQARLPIISSEKRHIEHTGYRAYHVDAYVQIYDEERLLQFPVEIQIKTLLQDAWANFGHDEFYKPGSEPPAISLEISRHLADALNSLDMIGQAIRDEKLRKLTPPQQIGREDTLVTPNTLLYLASEAFRQAMSPVELERCVGQLRAYGYDDLASVGALAEDSQIMNMIGAARAELGLSAEVSAADFFYFAPVAVREGEEALKSNLRHTYGFSEVTCGCCHMPVTTADKEFVDSCTDLDAVYYCGKCRQTRLKKCNRCDHYTEGTICKDCQSRNEEAGIL